MTDLYIDSIAILSENGTDYYGKSGGVVTTATLSSSTAAGLTTLSTSDSVMSYVSDTTKAFGLKFIIQIVNGSGSSITLDSTTKYRVQICTRSIWDNDEIATTQVGDIHIEFADATILDDASIYVGHALIADELGTGSSAISVTGTWQDSSGNDLASANYPVFIPDQYRNGTTYPVLATDFELHKSTDSGSTWTSIMKVGKNSGSSNYDSDNYAFTSGSSASTPVFITDYNVNNSMTTGNSDGGSPPKEGFYSVLTAQKLNVPIANWSWQYTAALARLGRVVSHMSHPSLTLRREGACSVLTPLKF